MLFKRAIRTATVAALFFCTMGASFCGKQALDQIDQAKKTIEEARLANAAQYAPSEFNSAEEHLAEAMKQYDGYKFRYAEDEAVLAQDDAASALRIALARKSDISEEERREKEKELAERLAYNKSSLYGEGVNEPTESEMARSALNDVHFEFDSFALTEASKSILAMNAQWLKRHPEIKVEIEGHCDNRGTEEYNQALGANRARIVKEHMIRLGVEPSRMRTISYGASVPLDSRNAEDAWAKNRRVHFAVR